MKFDKDYFNEVSEKNNEIFSIYQNMLTDVGISLQNKNILDIGCGTGGFLGELPRSNSLVGIDVSDYAIAEAKKTHPNIEFIKHDICADKFDYHDKFDLVTLFDVIEHLTNFDYLIQLVQDQVNKDGIVVITTPNMNNIPRLLGRESSAEKDPTHLVLFSMFSLDFFLTRIGLEKVELFTPYSFHFKNNFFTKKIPFGGQIVAFYKRV